MRGILHAVTAVMVQIKALPTPLTCSAARAWICLTCLLAVISPGKASIESLEYLVQEEHEAGILIGNILNDAGLFSELPPDVISSLRFNLLGTNGAVTSQHPYLAIHPTTGILTSNVRFDRDQICPSEEECHLDVEVAVSPAQFFRVINVRVKILDINDNAPVFPQGRTNVEMPESSSLESTFNLPLAQDIDSPRNGISSYVLQESRVPFEVIAGPDDLTLGLVVTGPLDRERTPGYLLTVLATDGDNGGGVRHTSSLLVNVTITDANDNHPVFDVSDYSATVVENVAESQPVVRVHASDADVGLNARIIYGLASSTRNKYGNLFTVDSSSGAVVLTQGVDREVTSTYSLTITARDSGANSRITTTAVEVLVMDVNDNEPVIHVNTLTLDGQPVISETAGVGTFVVLLSVTDPDEGDNGLVTCRVDHDVFHIDSLSANKFVVKNKAMVDRESANLYNVTVQCSDSGTPAMTSRASFSIKVVDANDFTPYFSQEQYSTDAEEDAPLGEVIAVVNATDRDIGPNGNVSYSLWGRYARFFKIGPRDGIITLQRSLDHETHQVMDLTVTASDAGDPPLSSTAIVTVRVNDINDEVPEFKKDLDTFVVVENAPPMEIGTLEANDKDSPPFDVISYSLQKMSNVNESWYETDPRGVFTIDSSTSMISTLVELDREERPVYYLEVVAANQGYPGMSSTLSLTVFVDDKNDNAPSIDFPNSANRTVFMSSLVPMGDIVTQVRAHDLDTGLNGEMTFDLININLEDEGLIMIDSASGLVYVNQDLSRIRYKKIETRVRVSDKGDPVLITERDLTIIVDQTINLAEPIGGGNEGGRGGQEESDRTMLAVICVVGVSGVLICLLLVAIVFVLLRSRRGPCCTSRSNSSRPPGKVSLGDGSVPAEIEWETGGHGRDTDLYKHAVKHTKLDRPCHIEMDNSMNVVQNNTGGRGGTRDLSPRVPHTVCHEMGISYVPQTSSSNKRKRGYNRTLPPHTKLQEPVRPNDLTNDLDASSASSGEMSTADSGRGASEEGERVTQCFYVPRAGNNINSHAGNTYPRLTTFKSPPQPYPRSTSKAKSPSSPSPPVITSTPSHGPPCGATSTASHVARDSPSPVLSVASDASSCSDNVSTVSSLPRLTVRNLKAKNKSRKLTDDASNCHEGSYSLLNNMLTNLEDNRRAPAGYSFNDANSLLKYKANSRLSETGSEMTDATSTTSGSYAIDTEGEDSDVTVVCAHKDVNV